MQLLTLLLFCSLQRFVEPNLTTFLNTPTQEIYCVAEDDLVEEPITWIYSSGSISDFKIIPEIPSEYSCDFEISSQCTAQYRNLQYWKVIERYDLILDRRWEGIPIILEKEVNIPFYQNKSTIGFSFLYLHPISAVKQYVQLDLCFNGNWHRTAYNETEIKCSHRNIQFPDTFKQCGNDQQPQWHHLALIYQNNELLLQEVVSNVTLLRSMVPSLSSSLKLRLNTEHSYWKTHKNNYLYTDKAGTTKIWNSIPVNSSELCVSAYVDMCDGCYIDFYIKYNNQRRQMKEMILNSRRVTKSKWKYKKYLLESRKGDLVELDLVTGYTRKATDNGFWAVDDIRICNRVELKIGTIKHRYQSIPLCQLATDPEFVVTERSVDGNVKESNITTLRNDDKTLEIKWGTDNRYSYFLVHYQSVGGTDFCKIRQKSFGFLISTTNKIRFDNLVPYTNYEITLFDVLTNQSKQQMITTASTVSVTEEETPKNITFQVSQNNVRIKWVAPICIYGPLFHCFSVSNKNDKVSKQTERNIFEFDNLQPDTTYSTEMVTSRNNCSSLVREKVIHSSFTTKSKTETQKPINLTYKLVTCRPLDGNCRLVATWKQPFSNNTPAITSFNIHLNRTEVGVNYNQLMVLVKIRNKKNNDAYYSYPIKGVCYNRSYNLSVQAASEKSTSKFETTTVRPIDSHLHNALRPVFLKWDNGSLLYEIPKQTSLFLSVNVTVIVQREYRVFNTRKYNICTNDSENKMWTAKVLRLSNVPQLLSIGDGSSSSLFWPKNCDVINKPLLPTNMYYITFIITNEEGNETIPEMIIFTDFFGDEMSYYTYICAGLGASGFAVLILLFVVGYVVYVYKRKKTKAKSNDNVYESVSLHDMQECETVNDLYGWTSPEQFQNLRS